MGLTIPDEVLEAAQMSDSELLQEIVLMLYRKKKISIGKASHLLKMNHIEFQHLLANQNLYIHYGVADIRDDVNTLRKLGRL